MINNKRTYLDSIFFLILAFGLPLICLLLTQNVGLFQTGMMKFTLFGIEAMTPTLAAVIAVGVLSGSKELKAFLKRCYLNNISIKYIMLGAMLPVIVLTITKLISLIFLKDIPFGAGLTANKLIIIIWALIAEELGWRGFLQEKLSRHLGHMITPLLVGCIWALWHYHLFLRGSTSAPLILFFISCISDSFGYYWLTRKSRGNILPVSLWHFTANLFFNIYLINPEHNRGSRIPYLIFVICSAIINIVIILWGNISIEKDCPIKLSIRKGIEK